MEIRKPSRFVRALRREGALGNGSEIAFGFELFTEDAGENVWLSA